MKDKNGVVVSLLEKKRGVLLWSRKEAIIKGGVQCQDAVLKKGTYGSPFLTSWGKKGNARKPWDFNFEIKPTILVFWREASRGNAPLIRRPFHAPLARSGGGRRRGPAGIRGVRGGS